MRCLLAGDRAEAPVSLLLATLIRVPPGLRPSRGFFCLDHCCCHPWQKPFLVTAEPPAPREVLTHSRCPVPLCWGEKASVVPTAASKGRVPPTPALPSLDAPEPPETRRTVMSVTLRIQRGPLLRTGPRAQSAPHPAVRPRLP